MRDNLLTLNWYALPNCPDKQLQKGKRPTDAGYDIRVAETVEVPTYQSLKEAGEFSYEEVGSLKASGLTKKQVESIPSLKLEGDNILRIKYKVPLVRTGIVVKASELSWTAVVPRSSTSKLGISLANNIGVIDYEYSGIRSEDDADEIMLQLISFAEPTLVFRGERVAQLIPQDYVKNELNPVRNIDFFSSDRREGFGSSGNF